MAVPTSVFFIVLWVIGKRIAEQELLGIIFIYVVQELSGGDWVIGEKRGYNDLEVNDLWVGDASVVR